MRLINAKAFETLSVFKGNFVTFHTNSLNNMNGLQLHHMMHHDYSYAVVTGFIEEHK